jgi:DNA ligase (NAD+)
MNEQQAKERIEKLKKEINHHRYLYHVLDKQEISDAALDSLKKELFDLEQKFPGFVTPDSPTQRIGGKALKEFKKVEHKAAMLSFEDAFSEQDMEDWLERISKLLIEKERSRIDFYAELKIDGLAVELVYSKGLFKTGSTRGDGKIGEDITQNLKTIESIPLRLKENKGNSVVRGEVFLSKKEFKRVNKEREKQGLSLYANPRNLAAGSVRQLDPKIIASRSLGFFAYDLLDYGSKHEQRHNVLKELGFKTNPHNKYCKDLKEVFNFYKEIQGKRESIEYEIDGIVVMINSNEIFKKLGTVGKAPRGAIALKFPGKEATTKVQDIKVQVGRTGALTPVAILKPVSVGGVVVSRATLHNEDEIKRLGVKIGDTVIVARAGDVVPDVIKVLKGLRTGREKDFKMPLICPMCKSRVVRKKGEVVHRCTNLKCSSVRRKCLHHFVSKPAFNIEGLGPKITNQLIEQGLISDPADLFNLKEGDLVPLERFAEKSASNLVQAIQSSKEIFLARFIYSLGIRNVGEETAYDLANYFSSIEKLQNTSKEDLEKIPDIGSVVAGSISVWFNNKNNKELLRKLLKAVDIKRQKVKTKNQKLKDLTFVFTGELEHLAREDAKKRVKELGGEISSSVSSNTDYVVVGSKSGSKYNKAQELRIRIIKEQEFLRLIG